jgi:predicted O-methyltransferase YrrM
VGRRLLSILQRSGNAGPVSKILGFKRQFRAKNILEVGIWDGGSAAFWFEYFKPEKYVAIDKQKKRDSQYFQRYKNSRGLEDRLKTYWGTDQADPENLRQIVKTDFGGSVDLVFDDASHFYEKTKASLELLFPLLRPGGFYVIEDWAWSHWPECQSADHPYFRNSVALTDLVFALVEAIGSSRNVIAAFSVFRKFAVIERGEIAREALGEFVLEEHISQDCQFTGGS